MTTRTHTIIVVLALLLLATAAGLVVLYPRATRPLVYAHQEALVDQAVKEGAKAFQTTPSDLRRFTFPIVMRLGDRTCVELRGVSHKHGSYLVCYSKAGEVIEERATSS